MNASIPVNDSGKRQEAWVQSVMTFMYRIIQAGVVMIFIYSLRYIVVHHDYGWGAILDNLLNVLSTFSFGTLIAGASFLIGGFFAFLFAIPKVLQGGTSESKSDEFSYLHNDNLVQISDWLTKIIVGVGLTQLNDIPDALTRLGTFMKPAFGGDNIAPIAGITVVLYFLSTGFLWSYLWSRLHLIQLFKWVDDGLRASYEKAKQTISRQEEVMESLVKVSGLDQNVGSKSNNPDNADPEKGKWGGKSASNDRVVTAKVHQTAWNANYYEILFEVFSTNAVAKPLTGEVVFHLHPSFPNPVMPVPVVNGMAKLRLVAWGAFTVGVETDNGANQLELDLATLPDAPQRFKEL
ncbi:MAG TPA: hypothetical protein PK325_03085 [Cyclobacteriaceae bacterium]|nr:hypothetical protein [Cyclobacteriaceae bacterium]HMV10883.1 hypothetical protein [Cyclobacteriaceae bacterium]HMV88888.1 hypothetical protein [Cyclobacteriaceae bacterium]HMW99676.1 hypothetical protein [Cyclobacteriaceae bacterium]HMX52006.1 hypothetical protein [Cyclobacteriaceae bacterium]